MKPWSLVALAVVSILVYAHAIRTFFSRAAGVDPRMRVLQWSGTVAAALHVWALAQSDGVPVARWLTSVLLYGFALCVFVAARAASRSQRLTLAFSHDAPRALLDGGVYAHVRHPFYVSYALTWVAGVVAAPVWQTTVSAAVMWSLYAYAAREEEQKFLRSPLATSYAQYCRRTGPFWPRLGRRWLVGEQARPGSAVRACKAPARRAHPSGSPSCSG